MNNVNIGDICALLGENESRQLKDLEKLKPNRWQFYQVVAVVTDLSIGDQGGS